MDVFGVLRNNALCLDNRAAISNKLLCSSTYYFGHWSAGVDTYFTASRSIALHYKFLIKISSLFIDTIKFEINSTMKVVIGLILAFHGLIHSLGFVKSIAPEKIPQLKQPVSRSAGWLWLITSFMFLLSCYLITTHTAWWIITVAAIFVSQILIISQWTDSRFGTLVNVALLLICIPEIAEWRFRKSFHDQSAALYINAAPPLLTEADLKNLPEPVKKYIRWTGAVGKPKIKNFTIEFEGRIRQDEQSEWMPFSTIQVNSIDPPVRLFIMNATMKHLPVTGFHIYNKGVATMDIRLLSLFTVQYQEGHTMNISETVTWFNDLCLFTPGALIDNRIEWQAIDSLNALATFTHNDISISARLIFDSQGRLIDFISNDRYRIINEADQRLQQFSTPIHAYRTINGYTVPYRADAVWNLAGGKLIYGEFTCTHIRYNLQH